MVGIRCLNPLELSTLAPTAFFIDRFVWRRGRYCAACRHISITWPFGVRVECRTRWPKPLHTLFRLVVLDDGELNVAHFVTQSWVLFLGSWLLAALRHTGAQWVGKILPGNSRSVLLNLALVCALAFHTERVSARRPTMNALRRRFSLGNTSTKRTKRECIAGIHWLACACIDASKSQAVIAGAESRPCKANLQSSHCLERVARRSVHAAE